MRFKIQYMYIDLIVINKIVYIHTGCVKKDWAHMSSLIGLYIRNTLTHDINLNYRMDGIFIYTLYI